MNSNLGVLNTLYQAFDNGIANGYASLQPDLLFFTNFAIVMTFLFGGLMIAMGDDGLEGVIRFFFSKILIVGWVLFLVNNWQGLTNGIAGGMVALGLKAVGGASTNFIDEPIMIVQDGYTIFSALLNTATSIPGGVLSAINHLPEIILYTLAALVVLASYIIICLEIFAAILEFKITSIGSVLLIPFQIWEKTAWMSQGIYGHIFNAGLKLFSLSIVIGMGLSVMKQLAVSAGPDNANAVAVVTGSLMFLMVALVTPKAVSGLISGAPRLGSADLKAAGGKAAAAGGAVVNGVKSLATGGASTAMAAAAMAGVKDAGAVAGAPIPPAAE